MTRWVPDSVVCMPNKELQASEDLHKECHHICRNTGVRILKASMVKVDPISILRLHLRDVSKNKHRMYSNKIHLLLSDLERERMVKHMVTKVELLTQAMMPITRATVSPPRSVLSNLRGNKTTTITSAPEIMMEILAMKTMTMMMTMVTTMPNFLRRLINQIRYCSAKHLAPIMPFNSRVLESSPSSHNLKLLQNSSSPSRINSQMYKHLSNLRLSKKSSHLKLREERIK